MTKLDILERDKFVLQILNIAKNISKNKVTTTFAIDGKWGSGKSFVLDMLEERLQILNSKEPNKERFFVIRYNCWKYDYYEEPLIAIVATILETIEKRTAVIDEKNREQLKGILKSVGAFFYSMGTGYVKEKTGIDLHTIFDSVTKGVESGNEAYESNHEFDVYFGFNKVLGALQDALNRLSEEYTVVFLVDELDRCLPEYAIKILERLHHLTEGTNNIINIVSIDKTQLQSSIKRTFGFEKPELYLNKFIQFTVTLPIGEVTDKFMEKYSDYISLFDEDLLEIPESIEEFISELFKEIDIRTQEQIMNRVKIAHTLLFSEQKDYAFMCMEILLATLKCYYGNNLKKQNDQLVYNRGKIFSEKKTNDVTFDSYFIKKLENIIHVQTASDYGDGLFYTPYSSSSISLYGVIFFYWAYINKIFEKSTKVISLSPGKNYYIVQKNIDEIDKFIDILYILE